MPLPTSRTPIENEERFHRNVHARRSDGVQQRERLRNRGIGEGR
jgi:hypothetical protein